MTIEESNAFISMARQTTTSAIQRRLSVIPDEEVEVFCMEEAFLYEEWNDYL